jgi:hypothetical protein
VSSPSTSNPEGQGNAASLETDKNILLEQMNSEYKLLQDKIDKIGAFRFTIRGWSVTLVIASIIAAGSSNIVSPYILGLLPLFVYALYTTERKQNHYSIVFGERALYLEKRIREELRSHSQGEPIVGLFPGLAHHLHSVRQNENVGGARAWVTDPDHFFYVVQVIAVAVAIAVLVWLAPASKPDSFERQTVIQLQTGSFDKSREAVRESKPTPEVPKGQERKSAQEKSR